MKKFLATLSLLALAACSTIPKAAQLNNYEADFKTVFQAALSSLKEQRFTVKNYDWNSGEIDAYLRFEVGSQKKEVLTTIFLEQNGAKTKVLMKNLKSENSAPVTSAEYKDLESGFFESLNRTLKQEGKTR